MEQKRPAYTKKEAVREGIEELQRIAGIGLPVQDFGEHKPHFDGSLTMRRA